MNQESNIPDCTELCKSIQHGNLITAAITKRSILDNTLCSYLSYMCLSCERIRDEAGRTALHVAASCGRLDLLRWLITKRKANINCKDEESSYTPLHRAIFYGKINVAVELMKLGASLSVQDLDCLTPLEHAVKDGIKPNIHYGEIYTWGMNTNNSLGPYEKRDLPEYFDVFHKPHQDVSRVRQVVISKFHSIILTISGEAFSCGHGLGGRLGLGMEQAVVVPKKINFSPSYPNESVACLQASGSRDHTLFLMSDDSVYSCGLNVHKVLGVVPPPEKLLSPCQVKLSPKGIIGIASGRYHSLAWTVKALYFWGLNGGQMGQRLESGNKYIVAPRLLKISNAQDFLIKKVSSSDSAIVLITNKGDIIVLHEYKCRKIGSRQLDIQEVSIIGGKLDPLVDKESANEVNRELKVAALTINGNILLWQESDPQLCRCLFNIPRVIFVKQLIININEILFVTDHGEAYRGLIKPRKKKSPVQTEKSNTNKNALHKFLEKADCIFLKLTKFSRIYRAISITSDPRGEDFCVIQQHPYQSFLFKNFNQNNINEELGTLIDEADESDNLHDVCFKIEHKIFPVHKYIVANKSPNLNQLFLENLDKDVIEIKDTNPDIFKELLSFIYTGSCDLIEIGEVPEHLKKYCMTNSDDKFNTSEPFDESNNFSLSAYEVYKESKKEKLKNKGIFKNPVRMLQGMAKKFGLNDLYNLLGDYDIHKFQIIKRTNKFKSNLFLYRISNFPEYYDITIECNDGKELKAHKCILAARMEYFGNMFSIRWNKAQSEKISFPYPKHIVDVLLEFLYTDVINIAKKCDIEFLIKILILSDQYFVTSLKEYVERLLATRLTLKNAIDILICSHHYNASQLKLCILVFIVDNMAHFLECQALEMLDDDILKEITDCYFDQKNAISCRVITPYSTAISDEDIVSIDKNFPVQMDVERNEKITPKSTHKKRSRTHKSSISQLKNIHDPEIIALPKVEVEVNASPIKIIEQNNDIKKRLEAISIAKETLLSEEIVGNYTKLSKKLYPDNDISQEISEDFPILNSPPKCISNSNKNSVKSKFKLVKISQKERKRLSSESKENIELQESPKNPWKINVPVVSSLIEEVNNFNINNIISDELKQKENLVKIRSKSLAYTQIEDKAIMELEKFYNINNIEDELIVVERVNINLASPIWVSKSNS